MKPTLLVLAAGMGSRYGGLKQMDPVGPSGETIIDYSIHDAVRAGFGRVVFVIRPDFADAFKKDLGARFERQIPVGYCYQELGKLPGGRRPPEGREKPWGTGHAVLMAEGLINEPFAIINADDFYGRQGFEKMARHLEGARDSQKADYCMVGYALSATLSEHGTVSRGVCRVSADGLLDEVVETVKIEKIPGGARDQSSGLLFTGYETVSMNFFGFTPSIFGHLNTAFRAFLGEKGDDLKSEFYLPGAVDGLIKSDRAAVRILNSTDAWFGITYREDKALVAEAIQGLVKAGLYPSKLRG